MPEANVRWTNSSVLALAGKANPIDVVTDLARRAVFEAIESGWTGPPYDPFVLAEIRGIATLPREEIADARTVPHGAHGVKIEFNPNRPRWRMRYSLAHELAHTLFPDCNEVVRNRDSSSPASGDRWQLELLCNIAAAELIMPIGTFRDLADEAPSIRSLMDARKRYDVSAEALLLRFVKLTNRNCAVFASARHREGDDSRYRLDYLIPSRTWDIDIPSGVLIQPTSKMAECTGVGFTTEGDEQWLPGLPPFHMECVGIPAYPGNRFPRVVGVVSLIKAGLGSTEVGRRLRFVHGNALEPRGDGYRIVAHVVNDKTANWGGGGFAAAVRRAWPEVQVDFKEWARGSEEHLTLGNVHVCEVNGSLSVASIVAQHGYGPSSTPRIRYQALETGLGSLATVAMERKATVHMPRIGSGQAGGNWDIVEELVADQLCVRRINVTVYDLPN